MKEEGFESQTSNFIHLEIFNLPWLVYFHRYENISKNLLKICKNSTLHIKILVKSKIYEVLNSIQPSIKAFIALIQLTYIMKMSLTQKTS